MRILYVPLEEYDSRYTLQLREWATSEFQRLGVKYLVVDGKSLDKSRKIKTGLVLDAHQRCYFAISQMQALVAMLYNNEIDEDDFILFEDMFHPGIESLAYIFCQQFKGTAWRSGK